MIYTILSFSRSGRLFLTIQDLFLTGLRSRNFQRTQPTSLGNLFLTFFFGFLQPLGLKFNLFQKLLLVFVCVLFIQGNMLEFVLPGTWRNRYQFGHFGPGLLAYFA